MFGVVASIAMMVGGVSTAMVQSEEDRLAAEESRVPVVEIQKVAAADTLPSPDARL